MAASRREDRVQVRGLVWLGVRTDRYAESVAFFREVLGIPLVDHPGGFAWGKMPDSSQLEVFPGHDEAHATFTTGPVPEFLVDDVFAAADELRAAGIELLDEPGGVDTDAWVHFRGPDGNVYGLTSSPSYRR